MFLFVAQVNDVFVVTLICLMKSRNYFRFSSPECFYRDTLEKFDDLFLKVGLLVYDITCIIVLNMAPVMFFSL